MNHQTMLAKIRKSKTVKFLLVFTAINFLAELILPNVAMALTAGAASPEFSSFEPVATTDMVNDFTGDFTYNLPVLNVPGPDGGGYSMSLSYHSGVSSEEEASWVGFGWTLNPGAINRQKRGFPDDFNNTQVKNYNKMKPNWTQTAKFDFNMEYNSHDHKPSSPGNKMDRSLMKFKDRLKLASSKTPPVGKNTSDPAEVSLSLSHTVRYNNYSGFSIANGFGVKSMGLANVNMNRSGGQNTFGFSVNALGLMNATGVTNKIKNLIKSSTKLKNGLEFIDKKIAKIKNLKEHGVRSSLSFPSTYSIHTFSAPSLSYSVRQNAGVAYNFSTSVEVNPYGPAGFQVGMAGHLNMEANKDEAIQSAYGYMYSNLVNSNSTTNTIHDYQIEKESTFEKHDNNLGIPFNNADVFSATGNGVVGGFRLNHERIGHYYPNAIENNIKIRQAGVELGIGGTFSVGFDIGIGKQKTTVTGEWNDFTHSPNHEFGNPTSGLPKMRFTNDPGGEMDYSGNYGALDYATITGIGRDLQVPFNEGLELNLPKAQSSSYIEYTNEGNLIKSIDITNKDGSKSNYGQPVYVKNEAELTVGLTNNHDGDYLVHDQPLHYDTPLLNKTVIGQKVDQKYASAYLLTSNKTFDYVDVDNNGITNNDFGGWTKFDYRIAWGADGDWYRYRAPYNGLMYNNGKTGDVRDQTGSMSSGEKEVYYLKTIETKTHIAFFVTNETKKEDFINNYTNLDLDGSYAKADRKGDPDKNDFLRKDGLDAAAIVAGDDPAATSSVAKGIHNAEKLERIVLYAKNDLSQPISTTYFDYAYSLCQGIPNNVNAGSSSATEKGKLTLKKVWTESGGVIKSKIAPYQFHYEYFSNYPDEIVSKYPWANEYGTLLSADQNPMYQPEQLDVWGFYQEKGKERFKNMQHWLSQKASSTSFDPAAWQLKRIQLPSGGEIHIQYEQKDYNYVQDHKPMAMVSLLSAIGKGYSSDENKFYVNASDIKVQDLASYSAVLHNYFIDTHNKLYFKALYAYQEEAVPMLNTGNPRNEYITGYTTVNEVGIDGGGIYLKLGDLRNNGNGKTDKTLPRYVCYQNLLGSAGRNLGPNAHKWEEKDDLFTSTAYGSGAQARSVGDMETGLEGMSKENVFGYTIDMFKDWVDNRVSNTKKTDACKILNYELSYFKLPTYLAKKGGGMRVKRLLSYDPGIAGETGDAMIYGSEYIYKDENGNSSGVASNEPPSVREENALVEFIERKKQKWLNKALQGRDTKQMEGPLGESILPAASVVHERVIIKNIHSGKTSTGYIVNKYNTVREFPMKVEYSTISKKDGTYKKSSINIPLGLFNMDIDKAWITQGYLFKENDMHGKLASQTTYSGNYDSNNFIETAFTGKTDYHYSAPGDQIRTLVYNGSEMQEKMLNPGTEEDITMFMSNVHERSTDFSVELDLNITLPLAITLGFGVSYSLSEGQISQHVTSKIVSQKTYLLSTTTVTDGVTQTSENLAFDQFTGDPVLTRTYDGYKAPDEKVYTQKDNVVDNQHNGYYYALNIPASWTYADMRRKSENPLNSNQLTASVGNVVTYGKNKLYETIEAGGEQGWNPVNNKLQNVVNASATVYKKDNWFDLTMASQFPDINSTTLIELNKHRYPYRTYVYRDDVKNANDISGKIYEGGVIPADYNFFDWSSVNYSNSEIGKWYSPGEVIAYSPNGHPLEEKDVLGISSTAKFGYNNTLPVLVAQNAKYNEVKFIDFEYGYEQETQPISSDAHSGNASYKLRENPDNVFASAYDISSLLGKGISIKLWLKSSLSLTKGSSNYGLTNSNPKLKARIGQQQFDFKRIAQTGEWSLYAADIRSFNGLASGAYDIQLSYNYAANEQVLIDDFRLQPLDAVMNCTVYRDDNKVAARFDDQHFGTYYEYNNKGQLVRESIETERGKKTLQEQQYNTPLMYRRN